jgi:tetratricopeptide (TPR) repeat protein
VLEGLLRRHPHHPTILAELVETHYGGHEWAALERLCRAERLIRRDSLFLALPLVQALTYQGRHREAAQAAVEAVVASPAAASWAATELRNLSLANPAGVRLARDGLRVAWMRSPAREDLLRLLAQLEWYAGNADHALALLETPLRLRTGGARLLTQFADQLLLSGGARDSLGAARALAIVARHPEASEAQRLGAAQRAFAVRSARGEAADAAAELSRALRDVPPTRWGGPFALGVARALREGGHTGEARGLLERLTLDPEQAPAYLLLERALAELRDGPPEAALPLLAKLSSAPDGGDEARFYLAEALFFAGRADTAAAVYENLAREAPEGSHADAALDRVYLIEDARPRGALALYARAEYERWRGEKRHAETLADSLFRSLPPGALWARSALLLSELREALGQYREALAPLASVVDSLPADRLAPLARKRRGDVYRVRL